MREVLELSSVGLPRVSQEEFEMNMRLLGARTIDELVPEMVDASALSSHVVLTPQDTLFHNTCKCYYATSALIVG